MGKKTSMWINTVIKEEQELENNYCSCITGRKNNVCAQDRLNGPSELQMLWGKAKDETAFWYSPAGVWTHAL